MIPLPWSDYSIEWCQSGQRSPIEHVLQDGTQFPRVKIDDTEIRILVELPAGTSQTFSVVYRNDHAALGKPGFMWMPRRFCGEGSAKCATITSVRSACVDGCHSLGAPLSKMSHHEGEYCCQFLSVIRWFYESGDTSPPHFGAGEESKLRIERFTVPKAISHLGERSPQIDDVRVQFFKGWFEQTLPNYKCPPHDALVLNLDADLYSSTIFALNTMQDAIVPGTYIYFDEFNHRFHELRCLQ